MARLFVVIISHQSKPNLDLEGSSGRNGPAAPERTQENRKHSQQMGMAPVSP
jgi:hypothetical protein